MEALAQLERGFQKAKERGARPELLKKLEDQMDRLRTENAPVKEGLPLEGEDPFEVLFRRTEDELVRIHVWGTAERVRQAQGRPLQEDSEADGITNEGWRADPRGGMMVTHGLEQTHETHETHKRPVPVGLEARMFLALCASRVFVRGDVGDGLYA